MYISKNISKYIKKRFPATLPLHTVHIYNNDVSNSNVALTDKVQQS